MKKRVTYKGTYPTAAAEIQEPTNPESTAASIFTVQVDTDFIKIRVDKGGFVRFQVPSIDELDDLCNAIRDCFAERDLDSNRWFDATEESETRRRSRE